MSRLEAVKGLVAQDPANSRVRFMLCMEYLGVEDWSTAVQELNELLERDPDYVAAYYQGGRASEQMGETEAARSFYARGMEVAKKIGDRHALSELQAAADILG